MVTFSCLNCDKSLKVPDEEAGKLVTCPGCMVSVVVPSQKLQPVRFTCPKCKGRIRARAEQGGDLGKCPECQAVIPIPLPLSDEPMDLPQDEPMDLPQDDKRTRKITPDSNWLIRLESICFKPKSQPRIFAIALIVIGGIIAFYHIAEADGQREPNWFNEQDISKWRSERTRHTILMWVGFIIGAAGLGSLIVYVPSFELRLAMMEMGVLKGLSMEKICRRVRMRPNIVSHLDNGNTLYTWSLSNYSITLLFKDDMCLGVSQEVESLD